ncbi:hypothetical protein IRT45_03365 [Nocardia sp. BSTN01]|uniref:hypothetical protein n=1 Tax=Nocardia sp. BSTN01 TaxID=2783665 RepID=UPI00188FDE65|nr:hypothetical protein [Nocardia sp. BSTN01]MBF4996195.1 hypothetical protein [Nocardia sp. BSTN01]
MTTSAGDTDLRFADLNLDRDGKPRQPLTVLDVEALRHSSPGRIADIAAAAALTGATIDVDTALRWGLVDRIEPAGGPS